jgi:transposase
VREIINGIFYVTRAGCPWQLLPSDLPPWGTVYRWFAAWRDDGRLERINHALLTVDRERVGPDASPTAGIIDSQSAKITEAGGPRGYDAGKKINGRKRHALVDTDGRGLVLEPHPANIQDRDGGGPLLRVSRRIFPFIQRIFADSGYAGEKVTKATSREVKVASEPEALLAVLKNPAYHFRRIGLEAGPLSQWLFSALAEAELPMVCVETRHMQAVLKTKINKTDRNDARGIAQMMRLSFYNAVVVLGTRRVARDCGALRQFHSRGKAARVKTGRSPQISPPSGATPSDR